MMIKDLVQFTSDIMNFRQKKDICYKSDDQRFIAIHFRDTTSKIEVRTGR